MNRTITFTIMLLAATLLQSCSDDEKQSFSFGPFFRFTHSNVEFIHFEIKDANGLILYNLDDTDQLFDFNSNTPFFDIEISGKTQHPEEKAFIKLGYTPYVYREYPADLGLLSIMINFTYLFQEEIESPTDRDVIKISGRFKHPEPSKKDN